MFGVIIFHFMKYSSILTPVNLIELKQMIHYLVKSTKTLSCEIFGLISKTIYALLS